MSATRTRNINAYECMHFDWLAEVARRALGALVRVRLGARAVGARRPAQRGERRLVGPDLELVVPDVALGLDVVVALLSMHVDS